MTARADTTLDAANQTDILLESTAIPTYIIRETNSRSVLLSTAMIKEERKSTYIGIGMIKAKAESWRSIQTAAPHDLHHPIVPILPPIPTTPSSLTIPPASSR